MITSSLQKVFLYNENNQDTARIGRLLNDYDLQTFNTENIYQLMRYAREVNPNLMIFNMDNDEIPDEQALQYIKAKIDHEIYPVVIVKSDGSLFQMRPEVAHYVHMPAEREKLVDIIDSYCLGRRTHDVLLLQNYTARAGRLKQQLEEGGYSLFEVHNSDAARMYLSKNKPRIVCVEYAPQFILARHTLHHERIFYVDRDQDITEMEKFLV